MAIDLTGISNENEFYTHHYLSAILENDLKDVFQEWRRRDQEEGLHDLFQHQGVGQGHWAGPLDHEQDRSGARREGLLRVHAGVGFGLPAGIPARQASQATRYRI